MPTDLATLRKLDHRGLQALAKVSPLGSVVKPRSGLMSGVRTGVRDSRQSKEGGSPQAAVQTIYGEVSHTSLGLCPSCTEDLAFVSSHWEVCSQLRVRLAHIQGFSAFLGLYPLPGKRPSRSDEVQQLWNTLKLGTPLCFLYNLLPGVAKINLNADPSGIQAEDVATHKVMASRFADSIGELKEAGQWSGSGGFAIADLFKEHPDSSSILKVIRSTQRRY